MPNVLRRISMLALVLWCACGANVSGDGWEDDSAFSIETLEQPLGEASCGTMSPQNYNFDMPDQWFFGGVERSQSPETYSHPQCFKAWVVGLSSMPGNNNIVSVFEAPGCAGVPPAGTPCNELAIRAILYRNGVEMSDRTARGTSGGVCGCVKPEIQWDWNDFVFQANENWHVAATVRRNWLSNSPTYGVVVEQQNVDICPNGCCYWGTC